jgi:hypothetical protein
VRRQQKCHGSAWTNPLERTAEEFEGGQAKRWIANDEICVAGRNASGCPRLLDYAAVVNLRFACPLRVNLDAVHRRKREMVPKHFTDRAITATRIEYRSRFAQVWNQQFNTPRWGPVEIQRVAFCCFRKK